MDEHLDGQLTKTTTLQNFSLVLLLKEQFVSFEKMGVRRNDQFITENSLNYVQHGDAIMIDRGFNTAETLGTFGAKLEIPSFTKGQSQL